MTESDVTLPYVIGNGPEVKSFDPKSPESGCRSR